MSKTDFIGVFAQLPENYQKEAILNCLYLMSGRNEFGAIDSLLAEICEIKKHVVFRGAALGIGITCAARSRNMPVAMARLDMLARLGSHADILNARANALLQIAAYLLPDNHTRLAELWTQLVKERLPAEAQDTCQRIGTMLVKQCVRNHDTATAVKVANAMSRHLA